MYRALKSLTDYLLIAQNHAMIEHFRAQTERPVDTIGLPGHGSYRDASIYRLHPPLADIYDKVEFDEETAFPKLRLIKEPEFEYITETRLRRPGDPRPATR